MSVIADLEKFSSFAFVKLLCLILFLVPGAAVIYCFNKPLIMQLDVFKLLLLSAAITLPLFLLQVSTIAAGMALSNSKQGKQNEPNDIFLIMLVALLFTNVAMYGWLVVAYLQKISAAFYAGGVVATLAVISLILIIDELTDTKKQPQTKQK